MTTVQGSPSHQSHLGAALRTQDRLSTQLGPGDCCDARPGHCFPFQRVTVITRERRANEQSGSLTPHARHTLLRAPAAAGSLQFAFSEVLSCLSTLGEESPDEAPSWRLWVPALLLGEGGHTVSQSWRPGVEDSRPRLTHPH